MSQVTNVILKVACGDEEHVRDLNTLWSSGKPLVSCDAAYDDALIQGGWYGGDKHLECEIYPAAFNHLNLDELCEAIRRVPWEYPDSVQLFAQAENQDRLREINLGL